MKLIIDIPDEIYQSVKTDMWCGSPTVGQAILKGTPLPKGHGRLIDEKEATNLIAEGKNGDKAYFGTVNKDWEVIDFLKTVSTIIEADKGEEKTGKWVWDWSISCECPKYVCSVCGNTVWLKTDRCPKCKAIMKGEITNDSV